MAVTQQQIKDFIAEKSKTLSGNELNKAIIDAANAKNVSAADLAAATGSTTAAWDTKARNIGSSINANTTPVGTVSNAAIQKYRADLQAQGLSGDQLARAMYEGAKKYGVSEAQLADAIPEYNLDQVNQWTAKQGLSPLTTTNPADALQYAIKGTQSAMYYKPEVQAAQLAKSQGYDPALIRNVNIADYMNPYTDEVINRSLSDIERARQAQANNLGFQASQAGAFGGSRQGVVEALSNEAYAKQAADTAAGLRQAGYNQALTSAGLDIGAQNAAGQFGAASANQANLANAAAQNAMNQFNVNAGMQANQQNLAAANQMGNLSNLGFGMQNTINTNLFNQGLAQQQLNQQLLNNAMTQYTNYVNSPVGALQTLQAGMPGSVPTSQTSSSTPSIFDTILGAGKTASSLGWKPFG